MRACVDAYIQQRGGNPQCFKRNNVKYGGSSETERSDSSKCVPHVPAAN